MRRPAFSMPEGWRPATFLERGIAVPFTTPVIAQSRCRPDGRGRFEMIVPNPSGGDGNYVMPLPAIVNFCTPTLHDQYLIERLETFDQISPATIRMLAGEAAREGYAGRLAAKVARQRAADDETLIMLGYLVLFTHVLRAAGYPDPDWRRFDVKDAKVRATAKACLGAYAPRIGLDPGLILSELEQISRAIVFVGLGTEGLPSPAEQRLAQIRDFARSLEAWHRAGGEGGRMPALIVEAADLTIKQVSAAMARCRRISDDVPNMLKAWFDRQDRLSEMFGLADWMLDGWPHICALWESVAEHERAAQMQAVQAIAELVPLLPVEVDRWLGADKRSNNPAGALAERRVRLHEDWRTGTIRINSREHQEQLRAYA